MKLTSLWVFAMFAMTACQNNRNTGLQAQIDSLKQQQLKAYKPGLGEFMSGIQVHHAKLWFAGKAGNWALADFEIKEIREALEGIPVYCADRPEIKQLPMIYPVVDRLDSSIAKHDPAEFEKQFGLLTITCNNCHQATEHGFNKIKIPDTAPFSNQDFSNKQ